MLCLLGVAAFGLFLTALQYSSIGTCVSGTPPVTWFENQTVVLFGWGGLIFGQLGWYANLAFGWSLLHLLAGRLPSFKHITLLHAVLVFWALLPIPLAHNEGYKEPVCALGAGFWLWVAAQAIAATGIISMKCLLRRREIKLT